jgi:hypothetical protein
MQQDMTSTHNCTQEKQHLWLLNVMQQDTTSPHILILKKQHTCLLHAMQQRYNINTHLNTDQNTCCRMWLPVYTSVIRHHHTFEYWRKQHTLPHVVTYIHIRDMTLTHIQLLGKTTHIATYVHICHANVLISFQGVVHREFWRPYNMRICRNSYPMSWSFLCNSLKGCRKELR